MPEPQPVQQPQAETQPTASAPAPPLRFRTLLYRFMFFEWMFADVKQAQDLFERHAALRHNRSMRRYLPVYLRRWSVLTVGDFLLGLLFERILQASVLSAWFFTWSCVSLAAMVVISVAWIMLANAR